MARGRKTGGRRAGKPNKRTAAIFGEAMDVLQGMGFNPLQRLAEVASKPDCPIDIQVKCCSELAQYLYPKRKAIEVSQQADAPQKVEYGWVARKSSGESSTTPSPANSDSTNAEAGSKVSQVQ